MNIVPTEWLCTFWMDRQTNSDCCSVGHELTGCNTNLYVSTDVFITQGNYIGYMFRLLNSHLQAHSIQVKSQDAVHTLGSQCAYISEMFKPYHLSREANMQNV